ncbi:hypothetical protein B484DRAFT_436349, partial [Ochromonadaceae sp. CCMP2298]
PAATGGFGAPAATGGFGAPAAAGGFGAPAATGGFGAPAAAGGFGSPLPAFGAPAAAAGAFGSTPAFGTPAPTTLAAIPSFGSFGTPTAKPAASTFSSFNFGPTPLTPKPAQTTPSFSATNFFPGAAPGSLSVVVADVNVCELPLDTPYNELPPNYRGEIDRIWKEMKQPMKQQLAEIGRSRGHIFEEVQEELRRIHVTVLRVENEQRRLQGEVRPFLAQLKLESETGRLQAAIGLQQIKQQAAGNSVSLSVLSSYAAALGINPSITTGVANALAAGAGGSSSGRGGGRGAPLLDEDLPCRWFLLVAEQLSARLGRCIDTVRGYERQLATRLHSIQQSALAGGGGGGRGSYGQLRRVGVQELVELMQEQAKVFLQVAAAVAAEHKQADALRQLYLSLSRASGSSSRGGGGNGSSSGRDSAGDPMLDPFAAADRKEAAETRVLDQRVAAESLKYQQKQQQSQPQSGPSFGLPQSGAGGFASPSFSLNAPAPAALPSFGAAKPATTGGLTGGFGYAASGGFGSPAAVGFGAAPAGGFGSTTSGGFGSTSTGGFGSAAGKSAFAALDLATPSVGGFGAPAAGAGAGFGAFGGGAAAGGFAGGFGAAGSSSTVNRKTKKK